MADRLAVGLHEAGHLPAAYGTEKHDDYYREQAEKAQAGELLEHELEHLREELDAMAAKGTLTAGAQGAAQGSRRGDARGPQGRPRRAAPEAPGPKGGNA